MNQQRVKNTPDNFDRFIEAKLDEVMVDPSLADKYLQGCKLPFAKPAGTGRFTFFYWFSASIVLIMVILFAVIRTNNSTNVKSKHLNKTIQVKNVPVINSNNLVTTSKEDSVINNHKNEVTSIDNSKPKTLESDDVKPVKKEQWQNSTFDSNSYRISPAIVDSLHQTKDNDSLDSNDDKRILSDLKQPVVLLKKADSTSKAPDEKKKAPYIIW